MIDFKQVVYQYNEQKMQFNFQIKPFEQVLILGPSGAGKSTLLSLIAGFIQPQQGEIRLNSQDMTDLPPNKRPVSMLFQDNNLFTHLTVEQNIALGINPSLKLTPEQKKMLTYITKRIGLQNYLTRYPEQLSGGQRQRVALGRCLVQRRPILLLDEPFSSLDPKLRREMGSLLHDIYQEYHLTTVMVSHQIDDIQQSSQRCLVVMKGQIKFDGIFSQLLTPQYHAIIESLGIVIK